MFTKSDGRGRQLVYCDYGINEGAPVFLDIDNHEPVSHFGDRTRAAAICTDGEVIFIITRGSNSDGQLGFEEGRRKVPSFTEISSLSGHKIRAAYAGHCHSLFETREGKILAYGSNSYGELLLSSGPSDEYFFSPTETTITSGATFCVAGEYMSAVFIGGDPPPNTPNTPVLHHQQKNYIYLTYFALMAK